MEEFATGLVKGKPPKVTKAFDQSTKAGKAMSEIFRAYASTVKLNKSFQDKVKKKYGSQGIEFLKENKYLITGLFQPDDLEEYLNKELRLYYSDDGNEAIVHMPDVNGSMSRQNQYIRLKCKDNKWTIDVTLAEANVFVLGYGDLPAAEQWLKAAIELTEEAETLDEFKKKLSNFSEKDGESQKDDETNDLKSSGN
jgi:hypothetical protein